MSATAYRVWSSAPASRCSGWLAPACFSRVSLDEHGLPPRTRSRPRADRDRRRFFTQAGRSAARRGGERRHRVTALWLIHSDAQNETAHEGRSVPLSPSVGTTTKTRPTCASAAPPFRPLLKQKGLGVDLRLGCQTSRQSSTGVRICRRSSFTSPEQTVSGRRSTSSPRSTRHTELRLELELEFPRFEIGRAHV